MFIITQIEDQIRVQPADLTKAPLDAVTQVIEQRFVDKVIPNLGLVVSIYDVTNIEGGFVYPNDGAAFFTVQFREGLRISLDFFDDILIPEHALQDPSFYDEAERLWVWKFDGNDMYMDLQEPIRFRVHSVKFNSPPTPIQLANATGDDKLLGTAAKPFSPMVVVGDINGDGLGCTSWWAG